MLREMITLLIERRDFFLGLLGEHLGISLTAILIAVLLGGLVGILISEFDRSAKPTLAVINFLYTIPSISMLGFLFWQRPRFIWLSDRFRFMIERISGFTPRYAT